MSNLHISQSLFQTLSKGFQEHSLTLALRKLAFQLMCTQEAVLLRRWGGAASPALPSSSEKLLHGGIYIEYVLATVAAFAFVSWPAVELHSLIPLNQAILVWSSLCGTCMKPQDPFVEFLND